MEAGERKGVYTADFPMDEIRKYRSHEAQDNAYRHPQKYKLLVSESDGMVQGFIGLTGDYIAGLFVRADCRSHGIGRNLLNHAKSRHEALTLHVYQKNICAVRFYQRELFLTARRETDQDTGEKEWVMMWRRFQK